MAYTTNNDKMLQAVLLNPDLMKFGNYSASEISNIYRAMDSDNCVINTVAQIIMRKSDNATEKEIYKEVTEYLKKNV